MNDDHQDGLGQLDLVTPTDESYVLPVSTMMKSLRIANPAINIRLFLLSFGLRDSSVEFLNRVARDSRIALENVSIEFDDLGSFGVRRRTNINKNKMMSPVAYAKAFLDRYLPSDLDRVICMDADIIVFRQFEKKDLGDWSWPIAAVPNIPRNHGHQFNSGFMLVNLEMWRRFCVSDTVEKFLAEYSHSLHTHDQHVLNLVFRKCWRQIK